MYHDHRLITIQEETEEEGDAELMNVEHNKKISQIHQRYIFSQIKSGRLRESWFVEVIVDNDVIFRESYIPREDEDLKIVEEMMTVTKSERTTRVIDFDQEGSMEQKKREGYF